MNHIHCLLPNSAWHCKAHMEWMSPECWRLFRRPVPPMAVLAASSSQLNLSTCLQVDLAWCPTRHPTWCQVSSSQLLVRLSLGSGGILFCHWVFFTTWFELSSILHSDSDSLRWEQHFLSNGSINLTYSPEDFGLVPAIHKRRNAVVVSRSHSPACCSSLSTSELTRGIWSNLLNNKIFGVIFSAKIYIGIHASVSAV